jgi:hypothetical protein
MFGSLENDFDRLYHVSRGEVFSFKYVLLPSILREQPLSEPKRSRKNHNHRGRIEGMRKYVEKQVKRKKIIRKRPKPLNDERAWLNHSDTRSISVDYSCPKLVCTAEEIDNSMSDLYFQEEILID